MHLVYVVASYVLFLALLPVLLFHPKLRHGVLFRLGLYRRSFDAGRGSPRIWVHGASAGNPLAAIDLFLMRSDEEAERVLALGAAPDRVWVTGNTKFDALVLDPDATRVDALRAEMGLARQTPVFMAGSTHEGEEELVLGVYKGLLAREPRLRLVIAPRYVERAGRIMAIVAEAGLSVRLPSAGAAAGGAPGAGVRTHRRPPPAHPPPPP